MDFSPSSPARRPSVPWRRLRAWCWRRRAWLGAAVVLLAVRGLVPGLIAEEEGPSLVAAARDLPAGQELRAEDLVLASRPAELAAEDSVTRIEEAVGEVLAVGVPAGLPLAPTLLSGPGAAAGAPTGTVVVPVRLADPAVAGLLHAGDRIDVLAGAGSDSGGRPAPAEPVARSALVVSVGQGGRGVNSTQDGRLVLLAVTPYEARLIGGAGSWTELSAVLVPAA